MNSFNRAFIALLALAWVAALGAAIWLVWDQARLIDITSNSVNLNFDIIADTQAEKILATIVAGAAMLPALILLGLEMKPSRRRDVAAVGAQDDNETRRMQARIDSLERDLAAERGRKDDDRIRTHDTDVDRKETGSRRWHLFPRH